MESSKSNDNQNTVNFSSPEALTSASIDPHAEIAGGVSIGRNVTIGGLSSVAEGASIGDNVDVHSFVNVGKGAHVGFNTELQDWSQIGDGAHIGEDIVVGKHAIVDPKDIIFRKSGGDGREMTVPQGHGRYIRDDKTGEVLRIRKGPGDKEGETPYELAERLRQESPTRREKL